MIRRFNHKLSAWSGRHPGWGDLLFLSAALVYMVAYFLARWRGDVPYTMLTSDSASVAGILAALDNPELFKGDFLLHNPDNFLYYLTIPQYLVMGFERFFGLDYGLGFLVLLIPFGWLYLVGFYLLGKELFGSRVWAVLLAGINMSLVPVGLGGEVWGLDYEGLPYFLTSCLVPYLLLYLIRWRERPERWPWLMLGAGFLVYWHSATALSCGAATWFALWSCRPEGWSWRRMVARMFWLGCCLTAMIVPYAAWYLAHYSPVAVGPEEMAELKVTFFARTRLFRLGVGGGLWDFVQRMWSRGPVVLAIWVWAGLGTVLVARSDPVRWAKVRLLLAWALGLVIFSVGLPLADSLLAGLSVKTTILRSIKFMVPLALTFFLWGLAIFWQRFADSGVYLKSGAILALGLAGLVGWSWSNPYAFRSVVPILKSWAGGHLLPPGGVPWNQRAESYKALAQVTPPGSRVFSVVDPLAVRYVSNRPVVWCFKDGGMLSHSNHRALLEWGRIQKRYGRFSKSQRFDPEVYARMGRVTRELGGRYFLGPLPWEGQDRAARMTRATGGRVIWHNRLYAIVDLAGGPE